MSDISETIVIDDSYVSEIMSIAGYPLLTFVDNDFELTEEQVKTFVIRPTMRLYYKWFPIKTYEEYSIGTGSFSYDFPNSTTFDILDGRLNTAGEISTSVTGNALVNSRNYTKSTYGYGPNMWGTSNSYGMENAYIIEGSLNQSYVDKDKAFMIRSDLENRKVVGYSTVSGKLSIIWSDYSNDFGDIPYNFIDDVIKLSQAKLLEQLMMIRGQANQDLPQEFNLSLYEDKMEELRSEVLDSWKKKTKVVILKGP